VISCRSESNHRSTWVDSVSDRIILRAVGVMTFRVFALQLGIKVTTQATDVVTKRVLVRSSKYHVNILLEDFNAKVRRVDNLEPTDGNDSLCESSNDTTDTVIKFATSKESVRNKIFPHRNMFN
jgi:hypothetical protein